VCQAQGVVAVCADVREAGGAGAEELAEKVCELCESPYRLRYTYELETPISEKISAVATQIYGADGVEFASMAKKRIQRLEDLGYGNLPICVAKTPASLSDDPKLTGRPRGFSITVSDVRVSAGAGFIVVYTGQIMTMPGLPKVPAALAIDVDDQGNISGLF
jgi:formate--tetrahydrofolate ligase